MYEAEIIPTCRSEFWERPGKFEGICGFCTKQQRCPLSDDCDCVQSLAGSLVVGWGQHECGGLIPTTAATWLAMADNPERQKAAEFAQATRLNNKIAVMNLCFTNPLRHNPACQFVVETSVIAITGEQLSALSYQLSAGDPAT